MRCLWFRGEVGSLPVSGRPLDGLVGFASMEPASSFVGAAGDAADTTFTLCSFSRACDSALMTISCCFSLVLAKIGTRSSGTLE